MIAAHVDDQIAAYAFGALSEQDRALVAEHLTACPACAGRVEEAESLAGLLPYAAAPVQAPPECKRALFRRLAAEVPVVPALQPADALGARFPTPPRETALEPPPWARSGQRVGRAGLVLRTIPWAAAIVGWLAAAVLLLYSHGQSDRLRTTQQDTRAQIDTISRSLGLANQQRQAALAELSYLTTPQLSVVPLRYMAGVARHTSLALILAPHYAHALIVARGLAVLPPSASYVIWARGGNGPAARLGTLVTGGPRAEGVALLIGPGPLDSYRQIGLTIERSPTAPRPSGPLIFAATL